MTVSIASVTTAYNAAHLLPRQIDALLRQSRPLQEIIVVDNCSTDDTLAMLAKQYPQITVLRLLNNSGAPGGCAAGWSYAALEKKHDWVWNFDNDSIPGDSALEDLLAGADELATDPSIGMLAPLPVDETTGACYPPLLWQEGFVRPSVEMLQLPIWFADLVIASGCMIRKDVIEKVGLPREDFFMDFFDFEYCLRMRAQGYTIAVNNRCRFHHELGDSRTFHFLGFRHTWSEHAPWREYYVTRNITYAVLWLYPSSKTKQFLARHLFRHAIAILFFGSKRIASLKKMAQGVTDGWHGKLGIKFLPQQRDN